MEAEEKIVDYLILVSHSNGCRTPVFRFVKDTADLKSLLYLEYSDGNFSLVGIRFADIPLTRSFSKAKVIGVLRTRHDDPDFYERDDVNSAIIKFFGTPGGRFSLDYPKEDGKGEYWRLGFEKADGYSQEEFDSHYPPPRKAIPKKTREAVYAKFDGRCAYCGKPIAFKEMQVDHLHSHACGGKDELDNLFPACPLCNRTKATLSIDHFRKYIADDAPRIHFKKNRKWYADADKIVEAYSLKEKGNEVEFLFEKKPKTVSKG